LTQSSDWSGSIWGLHDWADRPPKEGAIDDWKKRTLNEPGTYFKYNDVRVNVLSYSLLNVWRKPFASGFKNRNHGSDRSLDYLALVWLQKLLDTN